MSSNLTHDRISDWIISVSFHIWVTHIVTLLLRRRRPNALAICLWFHCEFGKFCAHCACTAFDLLILSRFELADSMQSEIYYFISLCNGMWSAIIGHRVSQCNVRVYYFEWFDGLIQCKRHHACGYGDRQFNCVILHSNNVNARWRAHLLNRKKKTTHNLILDSIQTAHILLVQEIDEKTFSKKKCEIAILFSIKFALDNYDWIRTHVDNNK